MTVHLMWDFDGVFNALSANALDGYTVRGNILFNPAVINAVNELTDRCAGIVESFWLTTREDDVLDLAASAGLTGRWPVVALPDACDEGGVKCAALRSHVAAHPCDGVVWIDDTLGGDTRECVPGDVPIVLVPVSGSTGLLHDDLEVVEAFVAALSGDAEKVLSE